MNRNDADESIRQINFASQEMANAYQKFQELKEHFEKSYSHFVKAQKHPNLLDSQAIETSYSQVNNGIDQLEKDFSNPIIQRLMNSSINQN